VKRRYTDADILRIRKARGTHKEIAAREGCSPSYVTMVKTRQRRGKVKQKRQRTGAPNRFAPRPNRRKFPDEVITAVRSAVGKVKAIALQWGMSESYASEIRNKQRRQR
jgi:hypothetical protein